MLHILEIVAVLLRINSHFQGVNFTEIYIKTYDYYGVNATFSIKRIYANILSLKKFEFFTLD